MRRPRAVRHLPRLLALCLLATGCETNVPGGQAGAPSAAEASSSSGASSPGGPAKGPTSASGAGAILYQTALGIAYSDLGSGVVIETRTPDSDGWMGYGDGLITDIEKERSAGDDAFRVRLRTFDGSRFADKGALATFSVPRNTILSEPARPSPDRSKLALVRREQRENESGPLPSYVPVLTVMDADANVVFTREGAKSAIWLTDDRLAVSMVDGLYTLDLSSGSRRRVGDVGPWPSFLALSPDASTIAFVRDDSVWRIGLDGTGLIALTLQSLGQGWLAWSPDGQSIAVVYGSSCNSGVTPSVKKISATKTNQDMMRDAEFLREGSGTDVGTVRTCGPPVWLP